MKKTILAFLTLILACSLCQAQEEQPTISADRPGALTGPGVMPLHKLQWETGVAFESAAGGPHTLTLNNTLLRFGLFRNAEIRVGTDFLLNRDKAEGPFTFGIAPLCVGLKTQFYEGSGFLPSVGLLAQVASPHIGTKDLLPAHLQPSLYLLFEHSITDRFSLGYNIGAEWDGETATPTTFLGLGLYLGITEKIGAFAETYNYLHPKEANRYMTEFGFTWLVSRRVQLDIAADLDFGKLGKYFNISCGVSWLIN